MTEADIQKQIVQWLRIQYPNYIVHHSANEGNRGGRKGVMDGARKKAMGQVRGFPDIIMLGWAKIGPVFFEVKAPKKYAEKHQKALHEKLRDLGYRVAVVRSIEDTKEALNGWLLGVRK